MFHYLILSQILMMILFYLIFFFFERREGGPPVGHGPLKSPNLKNMGSDTKPFLMIVVTVLTTCGEEPPLGG